MSHDKIKQSDVAWLRASMLHNGQDGRCALCGHLVDDSDAALDHCHTSGRIRGVLHRDCNILLGKIENFVGRYGKRMKDEWRLDGFLQGASSYMAANYSHNMFHFKHKTKEDKLRLKYKRLLRRSKKPETKAKYRRLIKELP